MLGRCHKPRRSSGQRRAARVRDAWRRSRHGRRIGEQPAALVRRDFWLRPARGWRGFHQRGHPRCRRRPRHAGQIWSCSSFDFELPTSASRVSILARMARVWAPSLLRPRPFGRVNRWCRHGRQFGSSAARRDICMQSSSMAVPWAFARHKGSSANHAATANHWWGDRSGA
jgi:hypothetical protein